SERRDGGRGSPPPQYWAGRKGETKDHRRMEEGEMTRFGGIVWALAIVGALCLTAGAVAIVGTTATPAPPVTQDVETGTEYTIEPWPTADAVAAEVSRDLPQPDAGNVTVVLAARWGYLNNSVAALLGQWRFNDTRTGGEFRGMWRLIDRRVAGELHGRF